MNIHETFTTPKGVADTAIITGTELNARLIYLSDALEFTKSELENVAVSCAKKESAYRLAKSIAYLTVKATPENQKATVATLEAMVDKACTEEREAAYIAKALKEAAFENIKSTRAQLSALQSVAATVRSEHELARY